MKTKAWGFPDGPGVCMTTDVSLIVGGVQNSFPELKNERFYSITPKSDITFDVLCGSGIGTDIKGSMAYDPVVKKVGLFRRKQKSANYRLSLFMGFIHTSGEEFESKLRGLAAHELSHAALGHSKKNS